VRTHAVRAREAEWHLLGDGGEPGGRGGACAADPRSTGPRAGQHGSLCRDREHDGLHAGRARTVGTAAKRALFRGRAGAWAREHRFTADVEGSYYYWATMTGAPLVDRQFDDSQLGGALIVERKRNGYLSPRA
jgi:hypothetical protein